MFRRPARRLHFGLPPPAFRAIRGVTRIGEHFEFELVMAERAQRFGRAEQRARLRVRVFRLRKLPRGALPRLDGIFKFPAVGKFASPRHLRVAGLCARFRRCAGGRGHQTREREADEAKWAGGHRSGSISDVRTEFNGANGWYDAGPQCRLCFLAFPATLRARHAHPPLLSPHIARCDLRFFREPRTREKNRGCHSCRPRRANGARRFSSRHPTWVIARHARPIMPPSSPSPS